MSRPEALSYQALTAIGVPISAITTANGCRTDIGLALTLEDDFGSSLAQTKPLLFVGALDMPLDSAAVGRTIRMRTMSIAVEFSIPVGYRNGYQLAHNALADLLDALPLSSADLPEDVGKLTVDSTRILRRPEGFPVIVAQVTARVTLTERKPTAQ